MARGSDYLAIAALALFFVGGGVSIARTAAVEIKDLSSELGTQLDNRIQALKSRKNNDTKAGGMKS